MFYENDYFEEVEEFTSNHEKLMVWYNRTLNKYLTLPYYHLLKGLYTFQVKCEQIRDWKTKQNGGEFHTGAETKCLVYQYAYCGAIEMLDPMEMKNRGEVQLEFIKAYRKLNEDRNKANRDRSERKRLGVTVTTNDPEMMIQIRLAKECAYSTEEEPAFDDHLGEIEMDKYLAALSRLTIAQRSVFDALAAHPEMTHKEIAKLMGKDETNFCKILKRIEEVFKAFLKKSGT